MAKSRKSDVTSIGKAIQVEGDVSDIILEEINKRAGGKAVKIGSGAYGSVYAVDNGDRVYKIGSTYSNGPYLSYIKYAMRMKGDNPYVPKIFDVTLYHNGTDKTRGFFLVELERLTPLRKQSHKDAVNEFMRKFLREENAESTASILGIHVPQPLRDVLKVIRKARRRCSEASYDLHTGNVMLRGTQLVITDPLA